MPFVETSLWYTVCFTAFQRLIFLFGGIFCLGMANGWDEGL